MPAPHLRMMGEAWEVGFEMSRPFIIHPSLCLLASLTLSRCPLYLSELSLHLSLQLSSLQLHAPRSPHH